MSNDYRVNPRKWRKWSIVAQGTFNKTYALMRDNPDLFRHPKDLPISKRFAGTTAWNAAWLAADHVDETLKEIAAG
jgi:hypothetical protein